MIYLLEDRPERQKQYISDIDLDESFIKNDPSYLKKEETNQQKILEEKFNDAKAIFIHRSFFSDENNNLTYGKLTSFRNYVVEQKIPAVFFSGGIGSAYVFENGKIANINSKIFYTNLKDTLIPSIQQQLKNNSDYEVNLYYLAYGKNYKINQVSQYIMLINSRIFNKSDDTRLSKDGIDEIIELTEDFLSEEFSEEKEKLINYYETKDELYPSKIRQLHYNLLNKFI